MNHLLKFQTSPGIVVEVLLKNSKHGRTSCFCRHCLCCRFFYRQNAQELSTYISPYKLLLIQKKVLKGVENSNLDEKTVALQEVSETLKFNKGSTKLKKHKSNYSKINKALLLKNNDSTQLYNPNLFHNPREEKLCDKSSKITISRKKNSPMAEKVDKILANESAAQDFMTNTDVANFKKQYNRSNAKGNKEESFNANTFRFNMLNTLSTCSATGKVSLKKPTEQLVSYIQENKEIPNEDYWNILPKTDKKVLKFFESNDKKEEIKNFKQFSSDLTCHESFIQHVMSSADILITNNRLMEAFDLLGTSRKKLIWKYLVKEKSKNLIYAYNILLNGLSEKGQWHLINEVIDWMKYDHIELNTESFAAILHCLAEVRQFTNEKIIEEEIHKIIKQLFANNISLDCLFSNTKLNREKTEKILSVLQSVIPFFNIKPVTINLNSDCPLTKNLYEANNKLKSPVENLEIDSLGTLVEEQLLLEKKFIIKVKAVCQGRPGKVLPEQRQKLECFKNQWRNSLKEAVMKAVRDDAPQYLHNTELIKLHTYITSIPVESLVDILMNVTEILIEFSGGYSPSKGYIAAMIGNRICERYQIKKKEIIGLVDASENLFKEYTSWYLNPRGPAQNSRQAWQMLIHDSENTCHLDSNTVKWPHEVIKKLGLYFLDMIIKEVKFNTKNNYENKMIYPVFYSLLRYHSGNWREEIKSHPYLTTLLGKVGFNILSFRADEMPMVCPPRPWKNAFQGGYLIISADFIRKPSDVSGKVIKFKEVPTRLIYPTLDSLNALQAIPWRVNEDVLDVALEVFKSGGSKELNVPHFPTLKVPKIHDYNNLNNYSKMLKERNLIMEKNMNDYGLWCEALYRLSLLNHFRKRMFWLPQNCDFRGRVYPVPSLLNHIGSDLFRSLIVFAKGKPLGPKGLDWLKIHVINLSGTHKRKSIEERLAYANEILPEMLNSAEKPLTGRKWWTKSDEPWQTLAGCMEIKKALSHSNPEQYLCSFPVHQDGSCNGLQHYAALGRDLAGAKSVNLVPFRKPQDVYSVVAEVIEEERKKDEKNGIEVAKVLAGFVDRKIVKQTVMTTVYGVTYYGAKLQIKKRLEEIQGFPEDYILPASNYLADKTFLSIKRMFESAKKIQEWFINCADVICLKKDYVQWPTPLGLPVVQHYGKYRLNDEMRRIVVPNKAKQKNAFPPNFIHTLDSCHMMLTALYCEKAGITFAAVHDCFWTHPCSVDSMNKICREQFISLHSQPILEDLSQFFKKNYIQNNSENSNNEIAIFEAVPEKGDFDLKEVMNSVYFFC